MECTTKSVYRIDRISSEEIRKMVGIEKDGWAEYKKNVLSGKKNWGQPVDKKNKRMEPYGLEKERTTQNIMDGWDRLRQCKRNLKDGEVEVLVEGWEKEWISAVIDRVDSVSCEYPFTWYTYTGIWNKIVFSFL